MKTLVNYSGIWVLPIGDGVKKEPRECTAECGEAAVIMHEDVKMGND